MTPHLELLAREGTSFTACTTPNVICQPARASLLTGLLPLSHGVHDNGIDLPEDVGAKGFAGVLGSSGYSTAFLGKAHFTSIYTFEPTGAPECRASMENYPPSWNGPYMGFDYVELVVEGHNRHPPAKPPSGQHYEHWFYSDGRGDQKNRLHQTKLAPDTGAPQTWNSALPTAWHNSTWVADRTIEFISRNHDRPFCAWMSFPDPHSPFDCPAPWCFLHDLDDVDLPEHRKLDLDRRPWWHSANLENPQVFADPRITSIPSAAKELANKPPGYSRLAPTDERQLRHTTANYYGMIALLDHNIGRVLAKLSELGLDQDTIIVFTADHGEWLGDHGLIQKGPMMYDGLLRVPLIIKGPGIACGASVDAPVSSMDVAPTLIEAGGATAKGPLDGRSLIGVMDRHESSEFALNEWDLEPWRYGVDRSLQLRTVRTARYRLTIEQLSGAGELYDLIEDPHELDNRFDDVGARRVRRELLDMIASRSQSTLCERLPRVGL